MNVFSHTFYLTLGLLLQKVIRKLKLIKKIANILSCSLFQMKLKTMWITCLKIWFWDSEVVAVYLWFEILHSIIHVISGMYILSKLFHKRPLNISFGLLAEFNICSSNIIDTVLKDILPMKNIKHICWC